MIYRVFEGRASSTSLARKMASTSNGRANEDSGFDFNNGSRSCKFEKEPDVLDFCSSPTSFGFEPIFLWVASFSDRLALHIAERKLKSGRNGDSVVSKG